MKRVKDQGLIRTRGFIGGRWEAADDKRTFAVRDPANRDRLADVAALGADAARRAVDAADAAFPAWRDLLPQQRCDLLMAWYELIKANRDDLATIMTLEQGKPLADSLGEIDYAASFVRWYAEEAKRLYGETVNSHLPDRQLLVVREPIGVVAAVTPWNFPSAMITRKAAAALAAGCTVVVRPASETPLSALALAELAQRAGFPAGVFNVVTGEAQPIVSTFTEHPSVKAVSFTGSTEVGRKLIGQGASTIKTMVMELGGHAPFIVLADADPVDTAQAAVDAKFQTGGQDCLAANRILVHRSIYEPFLKAFVARTQGLHLGHGLESGVDMGPLMHERAAAKCQSQVDDAEHKGARLLTGGGRHALGGTFFQPTVLADVTPAMDIFREETFGPVAAVMPYDDEDEAVRLANDSEYGLAAYVFGRDIGRLLRVTRALDYGMVAVNSVKMTGYPIPFGGVKQSGLGREGARQGLEPFTELKYICLSMADRYCA